MFDDLVLHWGLLAQMTAAATRIQARARGIAARAQVEEMVAQMNENYMCAPRSAPPLNPL
eukprot:775247-Prorocentrum_minimum.AAC.1